MNWPKNIVISLIEAYKDHPCLYSLSDLNYRNKWARRKAFEIMYDKLQHILQNISFQEMKMKVRSLRSTFIVEHRRFCSLVLKGAESYSPNLWCYDRLLFLADPLPTWQIKTTDGQIIRGYSRCRPNILRERKVNNNKLLKPASAVELKTKDTNEINEDIQESNKVVELINVTCTPVEEFKGHDKVEELKDDDKVEKLGDNDKFDDSEVTMEYGDFSETISCTSPKNFNLLADDKLEVILNEDEKSLNESVDLHNTECTKQIKAFCNFVDSSLHMIKNSKAQMVVQRQITKLLYDALDDM